MLVSGPHRDTITFIPCGDTLVAFATCAGDAASSTTDFPRKASRIVSTVWNGTRESAFTWGQVAIGKGAARLRRLSETQHVVCRAIESHNPTGLSVSWQADDLSGSAEATSQRSP
jgi:hypothetical protein